MKKIVIFLLLLSLCFFTTVKADELYSITADQIESSVLSDSEYSSCIGSSNSVDVECRTNIIKKYLNAENSGKAQYARFRRDGETSSNTALLWNNLSDSSYFKITIDNLKIKTANYEDIRVYIDYYTGSSSDSITRRYSLLMYTYDGLNKKHGPFYLSDFEQTGYYYSTNMKNYFKRYNLITDSLKQSTDYTITKVEILPFGNFPDPNCDDDCSNLRDKYALPYDSRILSKNLTFLVSAIKINGYSSSYKEKEMVSINEKEIRMNSALRMYDLATIKWKSSINFARQTYEYVDTSASNFTEELRWEKNKIYYGPPYTQKNRTYLEKFYSGLDSNKVLNIATTSSGNYDRLFPGSSCSPSVFYSISNFLPFRTFLASYDLIWNRNYTRLLGNLEMTGKDFFSGDPYLKFKDTYTKTVSSLSSELKTSAWLLLSSRIKSNTNRMWFKEIKDDIGNSDRIIGYTDMKTTSSISAIDTDSPLKIRVPYLQNLKVKIESGKATTLKFKYYIDSTVASTYTQTLDENSLIVNFCTDSSCTKATSVSVGSVKTFNSTYNYQEVTATYTPTDTITKVEIIPYGTSTNTYKVFWLNSINITVGGNLCLNISANAMEDFFELSKNKDSSASGVIKQEVVSMINGYTLSEDNKNAILANFLAKQEMYKAYSELQIGDVEATHYHDNQHIRMVTGNTHVTCHDGTVLTVSSTELSKPTGSCNSHAGIDPFKSYAISTDIKFNPYSVNPTRSSTAVTLPTKTTINAFGGLVGSSDYVAASSWTPQTKYTDLKKGDIMGVKRSGASTLYLEDKNVDYFINTKFNFAELFDTFYLPITFNAYSSGKVEKSDISLINPNTEKNVKDGFKGTIASDYTILSVKFEIVDYTNSSNTKTYTVYPSRGKEESETSISSNKRMDESNYYSLYYNLPDDSAEVNDAIAKVSDDFEVKVTVNAGASESKEVLHLDTAIYRIVNNAITISTKTNYIYGINFNDTVSVLKNAVNTAGNRTFKNKSNTTIQDNSKLTTGSKMEIVKSDETHTYIVIIKGDVTGSGTSTQTDVTKLYSYLKGEKVDSWYKKAGDVVDDSNLKINDVAKLSRYVKGKISSLN